jgi:hypothetical protein
LTQRGGHPGASNEPVILRYDMDWLRYGAASFVFGDG